MLNSHELGFFGGGRGCDACLANCIRAVNAVHRCRQAFGGAKAGLAGLGRQQPLVFVRHTFRGFLYDLAGAEASDA